MCESDAVSQQPPSPDPYQQPGQGYPQDPYAQQQGYSQPAAYPSGYGYAAPPMAKKPLPLPQIVFIAAWAILGLIGLRFLYGAALDGPPYPYEDFLDRFVDGMGELAVGVFYAGVLLTASKWLERVQED